MMEYNLSFLHIFTEFPRPGPIEVEDIMKALQSTRSSGHVHAQKYKKFEAEFGSHSL